MKKHKNNKDNKNVLLEIPKHIKVLYGKFYVFTGILFIFLLIYPFLILKHISLITNIGILLLMPAFYIIMVVEVLKKRETYRSFIFWIWVVLFVITYIISVIKFIIFT